MSEPDQKKPWTTFTGKMREMEKVVRAMPHVGAPAFRLFSAVAQGINEESGRFNCSDEVMAVMCGVGTRQSVSNARSSLAEHNIIGFTPGRPGKNTVYWLAMSDDELMDQITLLKDRKVEARGKVEQDQPRRIGVKKSLRRKAVEKQGADALRQETLTPIDDSASKNFDPAASKNFDTLHPERTPYSSSTDAGLDSRRTRGPVNVPAGNLEASPAGADLAPTLPSPSPSPSPPARSVPALVDDDEDDAPSAVPVLCDDPEPDPAAQAAFEREVFSWLGEGNVVRGRALAELIPVHMEKIHLAGSMISAGPMLMQARTAAISLEQQSQIKKSRVA